MTENVRKRVSKWDLASENHLPSETTETSIQLVITNEIPGDESKLVLKPLEDSQTDFLKWPRAEENRKGPKCLDLVGKSAASMESGSVGLHASKWSGMKTDSKDYHKESYCQPAPRTDEWRDANVNQESKNHVQRNDQIMSNHIDARQQQSTSISPKGGWNRSRRSRSRSPSQSRNYGKEHRDGGRERGWGRNRSRSRSPVHGFKRGVGGWGERRTGTGAPCRDFAAGRCKRGSECRYLHEDSGRRLTSRHHEDFREGKYERGQSPGYQSREQTTDSLGQRDHSYEKATHGPSSHHGGNWSKPQQHRSSKDNAICHDFKRGRCQRGSMCRYLHHDSSDDGWDEKGWPRDKLQDGGDLKESASSDRITEVRRGNDAPCKFFAEGRCRNGDKCRFAHQEVITQPDEQSSDLKSSQNSDSDKMMRWNGPTWDNLDVSKVAPNAPEWQKESSLRVAPFSTVGIESEPDLHDQHFKHTVSNNEYMSPMDVSQAGLPAQDQSSAQVIDLGNECVSEFSAQPVLQNAIGKRHVGIDRGDGSPRNSDSIVINTLKIKNEAVRLSHEEDTMSISNSMSPNGVKCAKSLLPNPAVTGQSSNLIGQSQYVIPQPYDAQNFSLIGQNQQVVTQTHFNAQNQTLLLNGQTRVVLPHNARSTQGIDNSQSQSLQIPPPFLNTQMPQFSHSLPSNQQSQHTAPQNVSHGIETQSQHNSSHSMGLDNHAQIRQEAQLQGTDDVTKSSQMFDTGASSVISGPVAQLSNLSASLSQIFGNGPQLPQLYAALNPQHVGGIPQMPSQPSSVSSFASTTAAYIQSNQGSWTQQQQGTPSKSTDVGKLEIINNTLGLSSDTIAERSMPIGETQGVLKTVASLQSTDGTTKAVDSESKPETKIVDTNEDNESKEKLAIDHSKDPNGNVQADGTSKANKDAKGTRLFRFALVEFVKDILRPTWKEGQMSKEAHKTIVKKVVDKVTGTLDANIPQTQDRIDIYLSYSKEKLTKLVQAYTEKYLKN